MSCTSGKETVRGHLGSACEILQAAADVFFVWESGPMPDTSSNGRAWGAQSLQDNAPYPGNIDATVLSTLFQHSFPYIPGRGMCHCMNR